MLLKKLIVYRNYTRIPKYWDWCDIYIYLSLRDNFRNGENIKLLFLQSLNNKSDDDITFINKETLNLSMFDYRPNEHDYTVKLNSGKDPIKFSKH